MLPGSFDHSADIRDLETFAVINGVRREIESVSLDREFTNDLPDPVVGGAGLSGGSGSITWTTGEDVASRELSPWHEAGSWPPQPGDSVKIYVSDGATSFPRFTGVIDRTRGTVGGGMVSDVVDFWDRLNVPFTREALLSTMPPAARGGVNRTIGLRYLSIITLALRQAGFFSTPPAGDNAALSVPFQGTSLAHIGEVTSSHGEAPGTIPSFHSSSWGFSVGAISARYRPSSRAGNVSQALQVAFLVDQGHNDSTHIRMIYGPNTERRIRIRVWSDRRVTAYWDNTSVAELSATQMRDANRVILLVKGSTWTLRNNAGQSATGTQSRSGTYAMSEIQVDGGEASRIAGLTVIRPETHEEFRDQYFAPDATFTASRLIANMDMSPRLESQNLASMVDEICQATLTAGWFDETGILRLVASDRLYDQGVAQTVTSLDDVLAAGWETSLLHTRSAVHVEWKSASISRSRQPRIELYRGSSSTMSSGDVVEVFATPSNDEEWFGVDRAPHLLNDSNWGTYNRGTGSFMGVHYMDDDNNERSTSSFTTTITSEELGTVAVKITHVAGSYGSSVEANLATSENSTSLRNRLQGDALPVIRGYGKGVWVDETYVSPITGDPATPELVHDFGPWGRVQAAQNIGDFIAERVARVTPTLTGLTVTYDPRRQLGDVINIQLGILDVTLRALIVGIRESHEPGEHSQQLTVRIIDATSTRGITYEELAEAWQGRDYNALTAVWANLSYDDFTNDPLRGAPN